MKTIQELYNEVMVSQELKEKFIEAANAGKQEAFLKELENLMEAAYSNVPDIRERVMKLVSTYTPVVRQ